MKYLSLLLFAVLLCISPGCKKKATDYSNAIDFTISGQMKVGDAVLFTPNIAEQNGVNYSWDFGDGHSSAGYNPDEVYLASGTYTVTFTLSTDAGHAVKKSVSIVPNYYFTSSSPDIPGDTIYFHFMYAVPQGTTYNVNFGDGTTVATTDSAIYHVYTAPGNYTVQLTATGDTNTYSSQVRIINDPVYTHAIAGSHTLKGTESGSGYSITSFSRAISDTIISLSYINPISVLMGSNIRFQYNPDSSAGNNLVYFYTFPPDGFLSYGKLVYNHVADSISLTYSYLVFPNYTGVGHPPPATYSYTLSGH